ncbi:hypothetical protein E0U60_06180 [Salmonella enterica subsp. enterica serovar Tees]|nr:hypothetical protein [Salmonella enterica subsp. enterica serovar Tees]EBY6556474.1 hypothetical protein [Salmonella enterica subsp. enterica serovar Tees]ECB6715236.1 hypothetical protein [Salmonella enterica subsp. enterica serovar Tees]EEN6515681.1 hypothetical protein [Salmonella enterica subsp. enterica serovar Tees]
MTNELNKSTMIKRDDINEIVLKKAFEFFYWFSRFEFCLKERGYLKSKQNGARAEPGWKGFVKEFESQYSQSKDAQSLVSLKPSQQKVGHNELLVWEEINVKNDNELQQVVSTLKTIRNNLFHGGKHSIEGWDDIERTEILLVMGVLVIKEIVKMAGWEDDFERIY